MEYEARMATEDDIDNLIAARFDYFEVEKWETTPELKKSIESALWKYFTKNLNNDFFAALIEDENGKICSLSFLAIAERPANPFYPTGRVGLFQNVLTYPEHRRKGYAKKVLNVLLDIAKRQNLSFVELCASDMGKPMYEKMGFVEVKVSSIPGQTDMKLMLV